MRVGPIAHGALLAAALGLAYQTWTRDKSETPKVGSVTVWKESLDSFEAFAFDGEGKSVRVERRGEGDDTYFWGQVTRTEKKKKPKIPVKAPSGDEAADDGHGHGAPGAGKPGMGRPGMPPSMPPVKGAGAPATGAKTKKPAPAPSGGGPGPRTPQARSPHHAGSDQGQKPTAPTAPAQAGTPASPAGDSDPHGDPVAAPAPEPEETTSKTKEFPIGRGGRELVDNLVHLHALRDLGVLTDQQKEEYELGESKENLTVFFKGGKQQSLIIGARVFGGGDRYVMNPGNGKGYVLSNSEIMRHIDGAENSLGLKALHRFQEQMETETPGNPNDPNMPKEKLDRYPGVVQLEIETESGSRTLVRYEQPDPTTGSTIIGWADKQKPGEADMTFGNLLAQIERLKPLEYDPTLDVSTLTKVLTLRYVQSGGKSIGTLELFRQEPAITPELEPSDESGKAAKPEFYVKTELTRIPGKVGRMQAERITDDLPQLFGAEPKKKEAKPVLHEPGVVPGQEPVTPGQPTPAKPAGSKPNPTEGNK
jgi:hypothetical protein